MSAAAPPPSPCVSVCRLDDEGRWCLGCGRTLAEIGAWSSADATQQTAIVERARQRLAQHGADDRHEQRR